MGTLTALFSLVLITGFLGIIILSFRRPMKREKFDRYYHEWFHYMELNEETEKNAVIKHNLYDMYLVAFNNMCKFKIEDMYDILMSTEQFIKFLETLNVEEE
jgi:hypothetical protein